MCSGLSLSGELSHPSNSAPKMRHARVQNRRALAGSGKCSVVSNQSGDYPRETATVEQWNGPLATQSSGYLLEGSAGDISTKGLSAHFSKRTAP